MMEPILKINDLMEGKIVKRPSKCIKSPYVADINIFIENEYKEILGHTAALGCCGLADVGASVLIAPIITKKKNNDKKSCEYRVYLSVIKEREQEIIVGIHPKLAEELVEAAIKNNLLSNLKNVKKYRKEATIYMKDKVDSRFDFSGIDENDVPFLLEVKNVPLADYEDVTTKERKSMNFEGRDINSKVAYFPDGYRKKSTDTISPRALKHMKELTYIKTALKVRCIMCYVIQRKDVNRFQPSVIDPEYRTAFIEAAKAGVEMITMVVEWTKEGNAYFVRDDLPISIDV